MQPAHHPERTTCLKEDAKSTYTSLRFRTTLTSNAALPGEGRDSVKLTALSTAIPVDTGTRRKLNI